jgi:hypothetical protein
MASLIVNGYDLSSYLAGYSPIFEPSWIVSRASRTKRKVSDFGQKYDVHKTRLDLVMPVSAYSEFLSSVLSVNSVYTSGFDLSLIPFQTDHQLFIPGVNITSGQCEFVSERTVEYFDFFMQYCRFEVVFAYSSPYIISGDYTAQFQSAFDSSIKTPIHPRSAFGIQANHVAGSRFAQFRQIRPNEQSVDCSLDTVKPYTALQILSFVKTNRSEPFVLQIANNRIFGQAGAISAVVSDCEFVRDKNGFYSIQFTITKG